MSENTPAEQRVSVSVRRPRARAGAGGAGPSGRRSVVRRAGTAVCVAGVLAVLLALLVLPAAYAAFGTDVPFLVTDDGTKGPAPAGERVVAGLLGAALWSVLGTVLWRAARASYGTKHVGADARGLWVGVGRTRRNWVAWEQVQAVRIVRRPLDGTEVTEDPPYLEVHVRKHVQKHVQKTVARSVPPAPVARLVDGRAPAPGVSGKRFVVALKDEPDAVRELAAAVGRFAPEKVLAQEARGPSSAPPRPAFGSAHSG